MARAGFVAKSLVLACFLLSSACIWTVESGSSSAENSPTPTVSEHGTPSPTSSPTPTATATATPTPGPGSLHVELSWPAQYTQVDIDLHLLDVTQGGALWNPVYDCYYVNCKASFGTSLDWGVPNVTPDNPSLDIDNISESVPENIYIDSPAPGTYRLDVEYYASHVGSDIPVDADVRVFAGGSLLWEGSKTLTAVNQVWDVGDLAWSDSAATFTLTDTIFTTTQGGTFTGFVNVQK